LEEIDKYLRNMYSSLNIMSVIKLGKMRLAEHVARLEVMRNICNILVGKLEEKIPLWTYRSKSEIKH